MSANHKGSRFNLACVVVAAALALPAGGFAFAAEQQSTDQIIKALKPQGATRSLTASPRDAERATEDARFVNTLRNRASRSLTKGEREQIAAITTQKPSIDLEITFDFNSADIGRKALPQVTALGEALKSADLKGGTFVIAGHTDGKGSEPYNQSLSERRAEAVKRFLSQKHGITAASLVAVGYGKTQLKNSAQPLAGENRRVQVVNVSEK